MVHGTLPALAGDIPTGVAVITGREDKMKVLSQRQRARRHTTFRHRLCCVNILLLMLLLMAALLVFSGHISPLL